MRLTVLGSSGTHPGPERACASYLVEHDGYRLLVDCGNGSLSNLQRRSGLGDLDQILISHLHPDHFADLYGLYYALRFLPGGPGRVGVLGPAGSEAFITQLLAPESAATFSRHLPVTEARAGQVLALGPLQVTLFAAAHPVETLAARIEGGGAVLAYSADSGPTDSLIACARGADLFLADCSWREADGPHPKGVHMTGAQAGRSAQAAGAARLVCTHVYPANDPEEVATEARAVFDGDVAVAHDLDAWELP